MMIQGIDSTFQELGYRVDSSLNNANSFAAQTGIRMKGQLSFRGKEKAAEYFDLLDIDGDGYLNYEDFRGLRKINLSQSLMVYSYLRNLQPSELFVTNTLMLMQQKFSLGKNISFSSLI